MLSIGFVGDFLYPFEEYKEEKDDKELFQKIDLCIGNLESPIIFKNKEYRKSRKLVKLFSLNGIEDFVRNHNIKAVSLANNHIFDFGIEGFKDTINYLDKIGVKYFGAGMNLEEATMPCILNIKNISIGLLSFGWDLIQCHKASNKTPGVAPIDKDLILQQIKVLRKKVDILIIFLHWGYELEIYPLPLHRKLARILIENGADFVIGSHPHIIQGFEKYRDGYVFYSLGNFFFPNILYDNKALPYFNKIEKMNLLKDGLLVVAHIDDAIRKEYRLEYFQVRDNDNLSSKYPRVIIPSKFFGDYICSLNEPLFLEDNAYCIFFYQNRLRKKGLPVFTGDFWNRFKYFQFKGRELLISLRNYLLKDVVGDDS